jgi:hypothetical protein
MRLLPSYSAMFSKSTLPPPRLYSWKPIRPFSYAEFVTISKEISTLENEMLELKESLAEWRNMPSLLHIDDSASVAGMNVYLLSFELFAYSSSLQNASATHAPLLLICASSTLTRCRPCTPKSKVLPSLLPLLQADTLSPRWTVSLHSTPPRTKSSVQCDSLC